jgi:amidohydrolase
MHACGHDGHTAILVGTALVLDSLRDHLPRSVRLVFQPAEELVCAGEDLVKAGVCDGIDAAFALHSWPGLPVGSVACKEGPIFAAADHYEIRFIGKGSHGAMPEKGNNPITPAATLAVELHALHERENAADGSVISVGSLHGGTSGNIVPDECVLRGTMRHLTVERGDELVLKISSAAEKIAAESRTEVEITHERKYSLPVMNSRRSYELVRDLAVTYLGENRFVDVDKSSMGAEDFAFYLDGRDGALFRLGMGEGSPGVHTPRFDFNDDALEAGILMFSLIALSSA